MVSDEINIYCDESCYLENEKCKTMLISCIQCPKEHVKKISEDIIKLKKKYNIWKYAEIKWEKVSKSKEDFFISLLDYFFDNKELLFRAIVIPDKSKLNHLAYNQDHNTFYYKMIYDLVNFVLRYDKSYNIYADKKENSYRARFQMRVTKDFLQSHCSKNIKMQNITSYKSQIMQLNDFIQGIVCYYNRKLHLQQNANPTKVKLIELVQKRGIDLAKTNYDSKFNLFLWESCRNV